MMNIQSARNVAEFVHVLDDYDQGRPTRLLVPGHEGKQYVVTLGRNGALVAKCHRATWTDARRSPELVRFSGDACQGNTKSVCYHVLAACIVSAQAQGKELAWCDSKADAERRARIDGKVFQVESGGERHDNYHHHLKWQVCQSQRITAELQADRVQGYPCSWFRDRPNRRP